MSKRRNLLRYLLGAIAGGGAVAASIPFIRFLNPGKDKVNPTLDIDISGLKDGEMAVVHWRLMPIYIVRRSDDTLERLGKRNDHLLDSDSEESFQPESAKNSYRSLRPDIFLAIGVCAHLGCALTHRPDISPEDLGPDWEGGFFCPCHGAAYDSAGRAFKGMPATRNMDIPHYEFIDNDTIRITQHM
jgi:ubiquinol-cytochrome c reductase iron-sulfur subunit